MKRIIAVLALTAALFFTLTACGRNVSTYPVSPTPAFTQNVTPDGNTLPGTDVPTASPAASPVATPAAT